MPGYTGTNVCRGFLTYSDDDGQTWSPPQEISAQIKTPAAPAIASGPGVGIQKRRAPHVGRIVVPMNQGPTPQWEVYAAFSDDGGQTWNHGAFADASFTPGTGNEVQVVELVDGSLLLNSRSDGGTKHRKVARSADGGQTWTPLEDDLALVEPQVMASVLRLSDPLDGEASRVLYAGPHSPISRVSGRLHLSYDEGLTWPVSRPLYLNGYGYGVLTRIDPDTIGVLFERDPVDQISLARVSLEWLSDGDDCLASASTFPTLGAGCAGTGGVVPNLTLSGCSSVGGRLAVAIDAALGGAPAIVLMSLSPGNAPLGGGCFAYAFPPLPVVVGPLPLSGPAGVAGAGAIAFEVIVPGGTPAVTVYLQALIGDAALPSGVVSTRAVGLTVR